MRLFDIIQLQEQRLDEVNMSPTNLRLLASQIDAQGGMEFEMCVPGIADEEDWQPDYSYDERVHSIEDVDNFFSGGDGHNSRQDVARLVSSMQDNFYEWFHEQKGNEWDDEKESAIREWIEENEWDIDAQQRKWLEENTEFGADEIDEIMAAGESEKRRSKEYRQANPEFNRRVEIYDDAQSGAEEELDTWVEMAIDEQNDMYENAYNDWETQFDNNNSHDEQEWLRSEGLRTMQDVEQGYSISWPYFSNGSGNQDIGSIAQEFEGDLGFDVDWNSGYHAGPRKTGHWTIEPDGSIDVDNSSEEMGLEFISPPMPINDLIRDLKQVVAWARRKGCYTNESTGLHMNVSIPGYSLDRLDYVKLALFLGDEHVLSQFGRESNTYCKSAMSKIRDRINPETRTEVLNRMGSQLNLTASKLIHQGITDKYTSINTKSNYIEFRSPGGDWLQEDLDKLENTLLRFVVALNISLDPESNKQEYAKKLYKLIAPNDDNINTLQAFSNFRAGQIDLMQLKQLVGTAQIQRKLTKGPKTDQRYWWSVRNSGNSNSAGIEVVASSKEEAIEKAINGEDGYPSWANIRSSLVAKPLRLYTDNPQQAGPAPTQPSAATTAAAPIEEIPLDIDVEQNFRSER